MNLKQNINNMKKEELLKFCRHYHGEATCNSKDTDIQTLFKIESMWVDMMTHNYDFGELLGEYLDVGLTSFSETDDVPVTLKALLFNRFTQYNDRTDVDAFKKWYKKHYD